MNTTLIFIFLTILTATSSQALPPGDLTSLLKEILSPKSSEQIQKYAENTPLMMTLSKRAVMETPGNLMRKEMKPNEMRINSAEVVLTRNAVEQTTPKQIIFQNPTRILVQNEATSNPMQKQNEFIPTIIIKKPELKQNKVYVNNPSQNSRKIIAQKASEIPMLRTLIIKPTTELPETVTRRAIFVRKVNDTPKYSRRSISELNVIPKLHLKEPRSGEILTEKVVTANVFIPAPSISTISTAFSNSMPQSRGQFLKKIPIPPPTI